MSRIFIIVRDFRENSGSYSGMVEKFSKHASKKGYKIVILCARTSEGLASSENLEYAEVIRFPLNSFRIAGIGMNNDYLVLAKHVKEYFSKTHTEKEDIILANGRAALGLKGRKYILRVGQPALYFLESLEIAKENTSLLTRAARQIHFRFQLYLERTAFRNAEAYIFSSMESMNLNIKYYDGKRKPYFIPISGTNYENLKSTNKGRKKEKTILFISAGSGEKIRKGTIHLEQALPGIFSEYNGVSLTHVGTPFEWNLPGWCKKRINSVGRVPWSEINNYYRTSDIVVIPSLYEIIPNVLLEAMSAGGKILVGNMCGVSEYVSHKESGYIFQRGNVESLKTGLRYFLDNPDKTKKFGSIARKKAARISYENYSKNLLNFLVSVNNGQKPNINLLEG